MYLSDGQYDRAIVDLSRAIRLGADDASTFTNRGAAYHDRGNHGGGIADYDRAISDFDKAIALDTLKGPRKAWPFNNRGNANNGKGQYDRAIVDFNKAIGLHPGYAFAYFNRGNAYQNKRLYDRAVADFKKAIQLKPDYAHAYAHLAWLRATAPDPVFRNGKRAL